MEHALLFTFLEASSDCKFRDQLHSLQSQQIMLCQANDDDELQTDGNRSGHFQNGELGKQAFLHPTCLSEHGVFLSLFPVFAVVCFRGVMFSLLRNFTVWLLVVLVGNLTLRLRQLVLSALPFHGFLEHLSLGFVCST